MTQTLRRELIQVIRKDLNDYMATGYSYLGEEIPQELVEKIADHVLSVSGVAGSPTAKKYNNPYWDLLHGKTPENTEFTEREAVYKNIAERLEKGLLRNEFPQTPEAQKIYRWIAEKEKNGENLDVWLRWAMDRSRANYSFVYHKDPALIKRDWIQAFASSPVKQGRKFEKMSDG